MEHKKSYLFKPNLTPEASRQHEVENKKTFTLNNCEFSIFETHQLAKEVKLNFDNLTFTAMLRGKKSMKLEDKTDYFDYSPGETVLVMPGETMVIDFPEADQVATQCITLSFHRDFLDNSFQYFNDKFQKVEDEKTWKISHEQFFLFNSSQLAKSANNIMRIAMEDNLYKDLMADLALKELLIRLMQTQAATLVESGFNNLKSNNRLAFITKYIKDNLHEKLLVKDLAKKSYLSKTNFFKLFKYELGISPNQFILNERISKAKELLKTNRSIKEVAFATGFSDSNHFIKTFKSYEGITPGKYQLNG